MFHKLGPLAAAAAILCCGADEDCKPGAPCYGEVDIVNVASGLPGALTPNTLASIYGTRLSYSERGLTPADAPGGVLPIELPGTGVHVLVGGYAAHMFLASPGQVNFLVPSNLRATEVDIQVVRDGTAGPAVRMKLRDAAPALFLMDAQYAIASHLDASLVTADAPALPGTWVALWATGLGAADPVAEYGIIPTAASWLVRKDEFRVYLDGVAVPQDRIGYSGLAPLCAGLYQINVRLPEVVGPDPEIRIGVGADISPPFTRLHLGATPP